jgi:hypothetical protein
MHRENITIAFVWPQFEMNMLKSTTNGNPPKKMVAFSRTGLQRPYKSRRWATPCHR